MWCTTAIKAVEIKIWPKLLWKLYGSSKKVGKMATVAERCSVWWNRGKGTFFEHDAIKLNWKLDKTLEILVPLFPSLSLSRSLSVRPSVCMSMGLTHPHVYTIHTMFGYFTKTPVTSAVYRYILLVKNWHIKLILFNRKWFVKHTTTDWWQLNLRHILHYDMRWFQQFTLINCDLI